MSGGGEERQAAPEPEPEVAIAIPRISLQSIEANGGALSALLQKHSFVILQDLPQADLEKVCSSALSLLLPCAHPPARPPARPPVVVRADTPPRLHAARRSPA